MAASAFDTEHTPNTLGRVTFLDGQGELPMLEIGTPWSTAEVYLNGATVTGFARRGEPPLLFMSQCSRFTDGQPIRGGVPVIFPWFGLREGLGQHGFARVKAWELKEFATKPDGSVRLRFRLPDCPEASTMPAFTADYVVTVSQTLDLQLEVTNESAEENLVFENCLHTYFAVSDAAAITVRGLKGSVYLDKVDNFAQKTEALEAIRFGPEVDRIYLNTTETVQIEDPGYKRRIAIGKKGSLSTVVWNPGKDKAQQMPDFGNDEFARMVCVESGNVATNQVTLAPKETSRLSVAISSEPL